MVGDYCVANNLKKQFPLWNNTRYQNESLNVKQRMDLLETIFNADLRLLSVPGEAGR